MKGVHLVLLCLLLTSIQSDTIDKAKCNQSILKQLNNGKLFSDTLNLNGKYLNELGNFEMCTKGRNDTKYYLNLYESKGNVTINDGE